MRVVAAYALIFYGGLTVWSVKGRLARGEMAPAGGLALALDGVTMLFAALGVLLGLKLALAVAVLSIVAASLLAAYHSWVLNGRNGLRRQLGRTLLAVALIVLLLLGD